MVAHCGPGTLIGRCSFRGGNFYEVFNFNEIVRNCGNQPIDDLCGINSSERAGTWSQKLELGQKVFEIR